MNDYIKREDATEAVWRILNGMGYSQKHNDRLVEEVDAVLEEYPAADVRPVVLCRDCKHSEPWYADKSRCFLWNESGIDVFNDGFCNYGKKREGS